MDREWYVHVDAAERLRQEAETALAAFHAREPLKAGMSKEELRTRLGSLEERVFLALLDRFAAAGVLVVDRDKVRRAGHAVQLTPAQQATSDRIEAEFRAAGVAPPTLDEAFAKLGVGGPPAQAIAQLLVDEPAAVRIREGLYFHAEPLQGAVSQVVGVPPGAAGDHPAGDQGPPRDLSEVRDSPAGVAGRPAADGPRRRQARPAGRRADRRLIGPGAPTGGPGGPLIDTRPKRRKVWGTSRRRTRMFGLGYQELMIILVIVLLLFGAQKLPELARGLGKSVSEFKRGQSEEDATAKAEKPHEEKKGA